MLKTILIIMHYTLNNFTTPNDSIRVDHGKFNNFKTKEMFLWEKKF